MFSKREYGKSQREMHSRRLIPIIPVLGIVCGLAVTLPGGTGDLFKFDTGLFVGLE